MYFFTANTAFTEQLRINWKVSFTVLFFFAASRLSHHPRTLLCHTNPTQSVLLSGNLVQLNSPNLLDDIISVDNVTIAWHQYEPRCRVWFWKINQKPHQVLFSFHRYIFSSDACTSILLHHGALVFASIQFLQDFHQFSDTGSESGEDIRSYTLTLERCMQCTHCFWSLFLQFSSGLISIYLSIFFKLGFIFPTKPSTLLQIKYTLKMEVCNKCNTVNSGL